MKVFCPRCGNRNRNKNAFCRRCGEKLPELKDTTEPADFLLKVKNLNTANFILTAILSLTCSVLSIYLQKSGLTEGKFIPVILLALSVFFLLSGMLSIYGNFYLKQTDLKGDGAADKTLGQGQPTAKLPVADFSQRVPVSVVENTTRKLENMANRKLKQESSSNTIAEHPEK